MTCIILRLIIKMVTRFACILCNNNYECNFLHGTLLETHVLLKLKRETATQTVPNMSNKKSKLLSLRQRGSGAKMISSYNVEFVAFVAFVK